MNTYRVRVGTSLGCIAMVDVPADSAGQALREVVNRYEGNYTFTVLPAEPIRNYGANWHAYYRAAVDAGMVMEPR